MTYKVRTKPTKRRSGMKYKCNKSKCKTCGRAVICSYCVIKQEVEPESKMHVKKEMKKDVEPQLKKQIKKRESNG